MIRLIESYESHLGRPKRELSAYLAERTPHDETVGKYKLAVHCLKKASLEKQKFSVSPRIIRDLLFLEAGKCKSGSFARMPIVEYVAGALDMNPEDIDRNMFCDLPGERLVSQPLQAMTATDLAAQANLLLVQGILARATLVEVAFLGNARSIVRHAKLRGLICVVEISKESQDIFKGQPILKISGPFSLFRKTTMYGRALAELVPLLMWSDRFVLKADCVLHGRHLKFELSNRTLLTPAKEPKRYDSKLEERFVRDLIRKAPEWDIYREPEPFMAGSTFVFPDFLIRHRSFPEKRWYVEVIGFWTPSYLENKLRTLEQAKVKNLILCVDESLNCSSSVFPTGAKVCFFKKSVDVQAVLDFLSEREVDIGES